MMAGISRLRTVTVIAGAAFAVLLLLSSSGGLRLYRWAAAACRSPTPVAVLDRTTWDFGSVTSGSKLQATFRVENQGGRRLILTKQTTSCECVSASQPEIVVDPGMTRELALDLDTEGIRGSLSLETSYRSNDPKQPILKFVLLADISPHKDRVSP